MAAFGGSCNTRTMHSGLAPALALPTQLPQASASGNSAPSHAEQLQPAGQQATQDRKTTTQICVQRLNHSALQVSPQGR